WRSAPRGSPPPAAWPGFPFRIPPDPGRPNSSLLLENPFARNESGAATRGRRPGASVGRCASLRPGDPPPTDARPTGAREALVVPRDEVPFDLLHRVERHAHHDEQRGAAEEEGRVEGPDED